MDYNPFVEARTSVTTLPRSGVVVTIREATLDEGMKFSEIDKLSTAEKVQRIKQFIASLITWDAKDRKTGQPIPVSEETIGMLPVEDGNALVAAAMGFINKQGDEKKGTPPSAAS